MDVEGSVVGDKDDVFCSAVFEDKFDGLQCAGTFADHEIIDAGKFRYVHGNFNRWFYEHVKRFRKDAMTVEFYGTYFNEMVGAWVESCCFRVDCHIGVVFFKIIPDDAFVVRKYLKAAHRIKKNPRKWNSPDCVQYKITKSIILQNQGSC